MCDFQGVMDGDIKLLSSACVLKVIYLFLTIWSGDFFVT